jgi:hypothetical protein
MASGYFNRVQSLLKASPKLAELGFPAEMVEVWGKGADHNDLLQVKKPSWRIHADDGLSLGYEGIEVHCEACRRGHWVIHCELWPRRDKAAKVAAHRFPDLLALNGGITTGIRELGASLGWPVDHGAHTNRARADPSDPSSLIVYTFELGLPQSHHPEQFIERIVPTIGATAPTIDEVMQDSGGGES